MVFCRSSYTWRASTLYPFPLRATMTLSTPVESRPYRRPTRAVFAALSLSTLLSACALSPGQFMGNPGDAEKELNNVAPEGALIRITPDLIAQQKVEALNEAKADIAALEAPTSSYKLGAGDIVNIMVWDHPELALIPASSSRNMGSPSQADIGNGYPISANGKIQFPYAGVLDAAGLTELELRDLLIRKLAVYINDPQVTVRVQSYRNSRVYVDGEVRNPGLQVMDDIPMTLPEALNRAGGYTPEADRSSIVLTRNGVSVPINLPQLMRQGINPNRIMLANGDMVRVQNQAETQIFVLGEVTKPQNTPLRDGRLTLTEALGISGGLNPLTADGGQVYVLRKAEDQEPRIFHLDANSPASYLIANEFQMQARDVVFVDPAPVVRWNRVVSNLLPSASTAISAGRTF